MWRLLPGHMAVCRFVEIAAVFVLVLSVYFFKVHSVNASFHIYAVHTSYIHSNSILCIIHIF